MSRYVFPGHPTYLEAAAAELGRPETAAPAGRIAALTTMAHLCAQASLAEPAHVAGILARAAEFRDRIATALRAAELMLADVESGRNPPPEPEPTPEPEARPEEPAPPSGRARPNAHPRRSS